MSPLALPINTRDVILRLLLATAGGTHVHRQFAGIVGKRPQSSNQPGRVATFPTMKHRYSLIYVVSLAIAVAGGAAQAKPVASLPLLQQQGTARQLIVDGKPFLVLGAELNNSSASSLDYMKPLWPRLVATHLNTVLATASWELIEPEEGKFDFALVDGILAAKRTGDAATVQALESEIDTHVFRLYALTPAEIQIVESRA